MKAAMLLAMAKVTRSGAESRRLIGNGRVEVNGVQLEGDTEVFDGDEIHVKRKGKTVVVTFKEGFTIDVI